ncbi:MAG: hypothetical protein O2795_19830 [Acidobacteria bacterium]|nr:hypothetical protein [Acidobacteriota bacterium]
MTRLKQVSVVLISTTLLLQIVVRHLSAETRGVEVIFKMDDKVVEGPAEIVVESGDRRAVVKVRKDIPPFASWSSPQAKVVVLPDWAVSADGSIVVSLTAKFKGRTLQLQDVKLWQGIGGLIFVVDRPPFDDDVDYALVTGGSRRTEAHALFLEPVSGDGYVMAHLARDR